MNTPQTKRLTGISLGADDFTLAQAVGGRLRDRYEEMIGEALPERMLTLLRLAGPPPDDSRQPR